MCGDRLRGPAVTDALRLAAADLAPGGTMTTGRLLDAIARLDVDGGWQRVWRRVGDPQQLGLAAASDSHDPVPGPLPGVEPLTWQSVRLTTRLTQSLWLAEELAKRYRYDPIPAGVVALALLGCRGNGATEVLLSGGGASYPQILRAVQSDVLQRRLSNLSVYIGNAAWR